MTFGPHLTIDAKVCDLNAINNVGLVHQFLSELPYKIGMTPITQPMVMPYSGLVPEDKGITGYIVIAESHISIHTFTEKDYVFFDCFSCKPFDTERVIEEFVKTFGAKEVHANVLERGYDFPR